MIVQTILIINGQNLKEAKIAVVKNNDYEDKALIFIESESDENGCSVKSSLIKYLKNEGYEMTVNKRLDVIFKKISEEKKL